MDTNDRDAQVEKDEKPQSIEAGEGKDSYNEEEYESLEEAVDEQEMMDMRHDSQVMEQTMQEIDGENNDASEEYEETKTWDMLKWITMIVMMMKVLCEYIMKVTSAMLQVMIEARERSRQVYESLWQHVEKYYAEKGKQVLLKTLSAKHIKRKVTKVIWRLIWETAKRMLKYNRSKVNTRVCIIGTAAGLLLWMSWLKKELYEWNECEYNDLE